MCGEQVWLATHHLEKLATQIQASSIKGEGSHLASRLGNEIRYPVAGGHRWDDVLGITNDLFTVSLNSRRGGSHAGRQGT